MRRLIIGTISIYQRIFSPDTGFLQRVGLLRGGICTFYPSCSEYTKIAIGRLGILKGGLRAVQRVFRCHPWQTEHIDYVE